MDTVEIVRTVAGIFLIIYGLGVCAYERFHEMKYIDQVNGVINGPVCIVAGVLFAAYNVKQGILVGVIAIVLWGIERVILNKKASKN